MTPLQRICRQCSSSFSVDDDDLAFLERMSPKYNGTTYLIAPPTLCPPCREQHRFAFRNEWSWYRRSCDRTEKPILSIYSPDKPHTVYEQSVWWSDAFDPLEHGRPFNFSRPFFEQWYELSLSVPRPSLHNSRSENCEYTNYSAENRNCYMTVGAVENEDIYYSYRPSSCRSLVDCYDPYSCELCYEVSQSRELYRCRWCLRCHHSSDLILCDSCNGCRNCFGCVDLRQREFHIFNQPVRREEYQLRVDELLRDFGTAEARFIQLRRDQPCRAVHTIACEDCAGDSLISCRRCSDVYILKDSEDCHHVSFGIGNLSCRDSNFCNHCELQLNCSNLLRNYNVLCADLAWDVTDSAYVTTCFNSSRLFGCIGMKRHQYCIFNRQYSREDYEALVPKVIEHMQSTGEWGEYFPAHLSPFAYNETAAQDYHPLAREEVLERGWRWHEGAGVEGEHAGGEACPIPDSIAEISDDITKRTLSCYVTGRSYRIIPQELKLYRELGVPIPKRCPEQRRKERLARMNPRRLWHRSCARCERIIPASYAPTRPEVIYCEECYVANLP